MRKTFVISSMMGGGAERVASILLNHWAESGDDVTLVTFDDGTETRYPLDARVRRVGLGMLAPSAGLFDALRRNGYLVPAGDILTFARRLKDLMASPSLRMEMGARATEISGRIGKASILHAWDRWLAGVAQVNVSPQALTSSTTD